MRSYLKFAKQMLFIGLTDVLVMLQSLIFLPLITKLLGPADYGVWSQLKVTMSLLTPFIFLGLNGALLRFIPGAKTQDEIKEGVFGSLVLISLIALFIGLCLAVFRQPLSLFFNFDSQYVLFLSLIIIFESLTITLLVVTRALHQMKLYFWFMCFRVLGELFLVVTVIFLGLGLTGAIFSFLLIRVLTFIFLLLFVIRRVGSKIPNFSLVKNYIAFGLPTIFDDVSYWVVTSVDRYLIGFFMGIVFVGYYAPAYSLGALLAFLLFPISGTLVAVLPKFYDEGKMEEVKYYLRQCFKYYLMVMIPAAFGISMLSRQILVIFSTQEISNGAFFVIPFVAMSMLLYGMTYFFAQILNLRKKTRSIAMVWMFSAVINLMANIILIPKIGILAAAITTLMAYMISFILMWYLASREFIFKADTTFIAKSFVSAVVMSLVLYFLNPLGLTQTIASIVLGVFIYIVCMIMFKSITKKEAHFIKSLLQKK